MPRTDATIQTEVRKAGAVRDYFIFTNLKYVLFDYQKPASFNKATADPTKFFFTVKNFDVQGVCYCNGMSDQCNSTSFGKCVCQKNTAGDNCERCLPSYNNKAWQYGISCQACNCSNLAKSCVYNATKGHGVCQNCTEHTGGDFCHECRSGFRRNSNQSCVDCGCDLRGVITSGGICNQSTGVCVCKANVQGNKCNACKEQFWGISASDANGCKACSCRTAVTVNGSNSCHVTTGQCSCMVGFTGRTCNSCKVGYYSSVTINPTQCTACGCNPSGSLNISCSATGACYCRPSYSGDKCSIVTSGYFSASVSQLLFSSLNAMVISSASYYTTTSQVSYSQGTLIVTGYSLGLDVITRTSTTVIFTINLPSTSGYEFFLRYMTSSTFIGVSMTVTRQSAFSTYSCLREGVGENIIQNNAIHFRSDLSSSLQNASFGTACLSGGQYTVTLSIPYNSSSSDARILIDSLLVMPSYQYSSIYRMVTTSVQTLIRTYYQRAASLVSWSTYQSEGWAYLANIYGEIYTSALACQCDSVGSVNSTTCATQEGQCSCKQRIIGRRCDSCLPDSFNFTSGNGCSACNCHSFGSVNASCDALTGICSCKSNVIGNKCNQCQTNHHGINSGRGCLPCNCSQIYSTGQQCRDNGTCICKPGIGGNTCSKCLPGYHNITESGCSLCSCSSIGSINATCNANDASCPCKRNTQGLVCNQCKLGYYGFNSLFSDACLKCQCSGHTSVCNTASGFYVTSINTTLLKQEDNLLLDGWTAVNQNGLISGKMLWSWGVLYNFFRGYAKLKDTRSDAMLYYSAPAKYLGDKRNSYMLKLMFDMTQQNNSQPFSSANGDVILKGNEVSYSLVTTLPRPPTQDPTFNNFEVTFDERFWRKNRTDGPVATSAEMIAVLRNVKALLIRGKWTTASGQFSGLANIRMQYSSSQLSSSIVSSNVENCSCPIGYTGLSCERCSIGYTRETPNGLSNVKCVPCRCNQHSSTCDPINGTCSNCQHSTTGNNCQQCLTGFYGNATRGTSSDCSPCPCPGGLGASNQFSPTCELSSDGQPNCTACQQGYTGRRCEICADGYSGNPKIAGGRCNRCICNNNIDGGVSGNCNRTTGQCLKCIYNTTGSNCEWCQRGFYGIAESTILPKCQACSCNILGSNGTICNNRTGRCDCKPNTFGRTCASCVPYSYNFTSGRGCQLCNCNLQGSNSQQCFENGTCSCKARVSVGKCDRCLPGFYDLSKGCLPCNCNTNFTSENKTCNAVTGLCTCKSSRNGGSYGGRQCNQCGPNAIGTPPDCALCHEPCYDNWQRYIAAETASLANLTAKTNTLLAKFGGMSYSQINSQLVYLNGNLSYASTVFEGAQYNTKAKETQFKQIEASIITFESSINRSESQLAATEQYFTSTSTFNGTVNLDSSTPSSFPSPFNNLQISTFTFNLPATASPDSITTMANGLLASSRNNNVTGQFLYTTTVQNYNQIQAANQSIAQTATDIANAMKSLSTAAAERTKARNFINNDFQATFQANSAELTSINTIVQSTKVLLNTTAATHAEAKTLLSTAQATLNQAETTVNSRRTAANAASESASQMLVSGVTLQTNAAAAQRSAALFKANADAVNYDAQQTAASVATEINKVSNIRNQTTKVIATANGVINQSIPVSLAQMESLSNQIKATSIDGTQINQTLAGASDGLKKAQDVQKLSQKALNASQTSLNDINNVSTSLTQAESIRNATKATQTSNDLKSKEIKNITGTVESQFRNLQGTGETTLALVNTTTKQVDASMQCFSDAKKIVDNTTLMAQSAQNSSVYSLATHQSNSQKISTLTTQINTASATTTTQYNEVQYAKNNATQLLNDVTEAERLLAQFITQSTELTSLQTEATNLETELDNLITKFEQTSSRLSSCNKN